VTGITISVALIGRISEACETIGYIKTTAKVRHPGPDADAKAVAQLFRIVEHLNAKGYRLAT
jgi:hypothetical protein